MDSALNYNPALDRNQQAILGQTDHFHTHQPVMRQHPILGQVDHFHTHQPVMRQQPMGNNSQHIANTGQAIGTAPQTTISSHGNSVANQVGNQAAQPGGPASGAAGGRKLPISFQLNHFTPLSVLGQGAFGKVQFDHVM